MATIDYKQKIKDYMNSSEVDTLYKSMLNNLFPELKESKESEDEKMLRVLREGFNILDKDEEWYSGITNGQILAWLEKQGKKELVTCPICGWEIEKQREQKKTPVEGEFPYDNPSDTLEGEIENIWGKLSSGGRFSATKEGFREVITHFVNYFKEQDDRELVEQKIAGWSKENNRWLKSIKDRVQPRQEWSEEDETVLNNLIYALANDRIGNDRDEYVSWLKSLKDRVQPQREWSEEDEKYCISVIEHLKNSITNGKPETYTSGRLTDWVRGMRERVQPQPKQKWKPTEEQIMCLQDAIDDYHRRGYKAETLKSLYEQLKQL